MWPVLLLLQAAVLPAQLCEVPAAAAARNMSAQLLGLAAVPAWESNPSVYVALRLADEHDLPFEARYLARLNASLQGSRTSALAGGHAKHHLQRHHSSSHSRSSSAHGHHHRSPGRKVGRPNTGLLALHALALRAACQPLGAAFPVLQRLKFALDKDWRGSRRHGHPLTNYYQYGLGTLAMCVQGGPLKEEVIRRLLEAQRKGRMGHGGGSAVDAEAVAGLAFACLLRAGLPRASLAPELHAALRAVSATLLRARRPDGLIGNVFSTPLALQFFIATNACSSEPAFGDAWGSLLSSLDNFTNPMAISQLLPVLYGRTYLDVASITCEGEDDTLRPIHGTAPLVGLGSITVRLLVECPKKLCHHHVPYNQPVSVPTGSSLLDVLEAAAEQQSHAFTFKTQDSLHGPFLTMVMKVDAKTQDHRYWQILSAPDTSLHVGIADYRPHDGETIILRLSKW
ncbi:transcobalamin-2 [Eudromia elegans]